MSAPDVGQDVLSKFAALSGDSELTILLGAGASAPSGLPTWDEFASRLLVGSGLVNTPQAAAILLGRQDPSIALEAAHATAGDGWFEQLKSALYGDFSIRPQPSSVHRAAAGHFLASPKATTLATLNFDTLLETALLDEGEKLVRIGYGNRGIRSKPAVHHLHGVVFEGGVFEPVVGYRDFAQLVADGQAWQRSFLHDSLARGPLLLAGTSYRDPDIRHWLHEALRDEASEHVALVTIVREGLGLSAQEFAQVKGALTTEWEAIGLRALLMNDLADVALVIRELRHLGRPGYRSPKERSAEVWSALVAAFSRLQHEFAVALDRDTNAIAEALGVRAHQGTLWVANSRGKLARFSTARVTFESPQSLKAVPTGHDSPWIAGEAIGTEEVKLRDIARDTRVSPHWKSVLAIPIFVGDGLEPSFATAVATFGLAASASTLNERQTDWVDSVRGVSSAWGDTLSRLAFQS